MTEILKKLDLFQQVTDFELEFLSRYLVEKTYNSGEVILHQGSRGGDLYLIQSGEVSVNVTLPGDITREATRLGTGQIFGEVTFLANALITATITAEGSRVECIIFYRKILEMLRVAFPGAAYKIEHAIAMQVNVKLLQNLERITSLLRSIPEKYVIPSEHALYLPNGRSRSKPVDINSINRDLIKNMNFFQELSATEVETLLPLMNARYYDKGYQFSTEDKAPRTINLVCSGAVMLFIKQNDQLRKSVAVSGIGELFIQNFFSYEFRTVAKYVSCEESIILELSYEEYCKLETTHPAIFYAISRHIHCTIAASLYIVNRQFVRINSEYKDLLI
ncbi:cyclic nucleotide-binding domain-containing protein [Legionella dresdenensis]|uniref:Cyclic nucleotide-binding domain-containing protein n=1 Tax=Legionella dresdenensis TaxID=450200 RepID=A0ABV8CHW9_9GAMM